MTSDYNKEYYNQLQRVKSRHYRQHGGCITYHCIQAAQRAMLPKTPNDDIPYEDIDYPIALNTR